jgi:integrase
MNTNAMRKFPREYCAKYPSIAKVFEAIAGARRRGSEISVSNYVNAVAKFVKYLGFQDPETALQSMLKGEIDAGAKVDSFIDYALKELGNSHATTRNSVFGIKKWMELNGLKIDWAKIELPSSGETTENDRAPTKEELKMLLNHASSARDHFFIFAATSSGLRVGTLLSLKIGDIDLSYPDVARVTVERKRGRKFSSRGSVSSKFFCTWLTPEARNSLKQYLTERKQSGEELTPESPLIGDYLHKGTFISIEAIQRNWVRLLKRAGLAKKSANWYELHIHTLRKFFRSNCIGVDISYREKWMGHRGQYLDMSYFKAEETLNLAEYRKTIQYLTINALPTEEKKLRSQMLLDFAKMRGYEPDQLKKLEDVLARSKDIEEAIT